MKITARGRYAILAIFDLAHLSHGKPIPLREVSLNQNLPLPFLEKVFRKLAQAGLLKSSPGAKGGYALTQKCNEISIGEVLRIVDSNLEVTPEKKRLNSPRSTPESMSNLLWKQIDERLLGILETMTIADICAESYSNTCQVCNCQDYVDEVQSMMANGKPMGCAKLIKNPT